MDDEDGSGADPEQIELKDQDVMYICWTDIISPWSNHPLVLLTGAFYAQTDVGQLLSLITCIIYLFM